MKPNDISSRLRPTAGMIRMALASVSAIIIAVLLGACSTTRRLGPDETLYTGVKWIHINPTDNEKLPGEMVGDIKQSINVKPNNPLYSPYVRTPFPIGLWVYNNWNDSAKGLKGWLYRKLVAQPVLVSDVRPEVRTKMIEQILDNNGYFGSTARYELQYDKRNEKKARINYTVNVSSPYLLDSIIYIGDKGNPLAESVDSLARKSLYLKKGERFCVDSLNSVRVQIVNRLRNRGYYFMRPEYIEFLADSLIKPHAITLKMKFADNMGEFVKQRWRTGKIVTTVLRRYRNNPANADTLHTKRGDVIVMRPSRLRESLIPSCVTFRDGKYFSVRDMDRTQTRLSRLGIFSDIQIQPVPADTTISGDPRLDVFITCKYDTPMEASIEVNASSKSNSYIGPGLILGLTHNNLFGGAEKLSVKFNANYEWQTGRDRSSIFNSYEFGLTATLAFPRLLAPKFIKRTQRELNWTTISLGADILNRPHYFKMAEFDVGITYDWQTSRHVSHSFTPFKLAYTKLMRTTQEFDSIMSMNPAVALSFQSQYIPQLRYTYTYDRWFERERNNGITFTGTFIEAGNLFDAIYMACGHHGGPGTKELFGTPFSQFVKGQAQLVYHRRLVPKSEQWLVTRVLLGAAHAYGNSTEVPYAEQFYIGGANSIRAFTVRSIGPGSYRPSADQVNGYFDQTGTFKFEMNVEYRFPIISVLHGAVFVDAGNIWLLKNDPLRSGGQLKAKTFLRDIALGTGVGLRVDIGMMVIRGDLGYGLHVPYRHGAYFNIPFKKAFAFHLAIGYPF